MHSGRCSYGPVLDFSDGYFADDSKAGAVRSYRPFILYNLAAVVGLIIAAVRGRSNAATLLAGGFVNYHTLALKQTIYIGVVLLLTMALGMEPEFRHMRIAVLFAFLGTVYVVFLLCHFFIPSRLADQLFSDAHEQRTLLVGPVEKARAVNKWILRDGRFRIRIAREADRRR